ncbi:hypothetical protein TNCV_3799701 [Trichonephila clavipes]|nr:hypothetical protein TNCV_3799701 [Trichonephila clavipes]
MRMKEEQKCLPEERYAAAQPAAVEEEKGLSKVSSQVSELDCVGVLWCFSTNPLGESLVPSIELFHSQPSQEETLICRLVIRYKEEDSNREEGGKEAELLNAMWLWPIGKGPLVPVLKNTSNCDPTKLHVTPPYKKQLPNWSRSLFPYSA